MCVCVFVRVCVCVCVCVCVSVRACEGCVKSLAIYESLECQGAACQRPPGAGARTVLCERCALDLDLRKMLAAKTSGPDVKRNFVCQCPKGAEVKTTLYAVTTGGADNAQRVFPLSQVAQVALVLDGNRLFNEKPSLLALVDDPDALQRHLRSCVRMLGEHVQYGSTYNSSGMQYSSDAKRVSVQFVWDEFAQCVRLLAMTPSTTVKITKNGERARTKGTRGATRSCGPKKARAGTSSDGAEREMSDKNGEGVVSYLFALKGLEGEDGQVELVCDGVLKASGMAALFQRMGDENLATVLSFCPMATLDSIATNIRVDQEEDAVRKDLFLQICKANGVAVGAENGVYAMTQVDAGRERLFRGVAESLAICGFGERADKWDWQVVVLRRGRTYLTLYVLVVHAPYPGMWVIVERKHVGATVEACTQSFMMVGEDLAPFSEFNNGVTVQRGLWEEHYMPLYLGFSSKSFALERCLNTRPEDAGLAIAECVACGFMTMEDVKTGFLAQKKRITAKFAQEDLACNNSYIEKMTAEHAAAQLEDGGAAEMLAGTVLDLGPYGTLGVVVKQHEDKDNEDGETLTRVTAAGNELRARVDAKQLVKVHLTHNIGTHAKAHETEMQLQLVYVGQHGDEDVEAAPLAWGPGFWTFETPYPLEFDEDEGTNFWVVRAGREEVVRLRFDRV